MSQAPKKYQRSTNGREIWLESDLGGLQPLKATKQ